jgi:hypothetical protein
MISTITNKNHKIAQIKANPASFHIFFKFDLKASQNFIFQSVSICLTISTIIQDVKVNEKLINQNIQKQIKFNCQSSFGNFI